MPRLRGPLTERPSGDHAWHTRRAPLWYRGGHDQLSGEVLPSTGRPFSHDTDLSWIGFNRGRFLTELAQSAR